ncbi:hypothetical protein VOLCADRAFT_66153 [Volvox carteri f. nagariensis]|uniref:Peroxisomal biogenesis factor 11 n=1 Tax=Volvox carteri f. nagariensis TaxID=3068 RepID=D8UAR8_VOLCA|nr:uncharacterized protein VOLCADRAFT_66153 [Volvox carteri f. nagariensis]EFJ43205.1 hypothetical protein VOLCADRAFT_66153 [Volvox carteri f. nagariensis]|eukprot:XP_002955780.1 hypothetical protein VOLCADRAFT_66153 [Volvox carteri f. nagariensis]
MASQEDVFDKISRFLAKREGIDKTLKVLRYSARLAVALSPKDQELTKRLSSFEKSVGVSRKAFRLGKFLQDVNSLRHSKTKDATIILELLAYGGEGIYYFIEQFTWLVKTGALNKDLEERLAYASAFAELVGYAGNIWISYLKLEKLIKQESELTERLLKLRKGVTDAKLESTLVTLRFQRNLRCALIVQDIADSVMALNDVTGGRHRALNSPVVLALAGLTSGCISFYKNWNL